MAQWGFRHSLQRRNRPGFTPSSLFSCNRGCRHSNRGLNHNMWYKIQRTTHHIGFRPIFRQEKLQPTNLEHGAPRFEKVPKIKAVPVLNPLLPVALRILLSLPSVIPFPTCLGVACGDSVRQNGGTSYPSSCTGPFVTRIEWRDFTPFIGF